MLGNPARFARWLGYAASVLLLAATIGHAAEVGRQPANERPVRPATPDAVQRLAQEMLEQMAQGQRGDLDRELQELMQLQQAQLRMLLQLQRQMQQANPGGGLFLNPRLIQPGLIQPGLRLPALASGRLGVRLEPPGDALVEHLGLPPNQGLLVVDVAPDSAAAKAGIKKFDIVIELNGKKVPSQMSEFQKEIAELKADEEVTLGIIRKGVPEAIKGVKLPDQREAPAVERGVPGRILHRGLRVSSAGLPGSTSVQVNNDAFTIKHVDGPITITIEGRMKDGAQPTDVRVQDGNAEHRAASVDRLPEAYRDKVERLLKGIR